ncbi:MAG: heparinase II/III-family protein, partial [Clostridia bacterium]|nr:heparinase II/III-family protein [Clostridia bacterium]
KEGVQPDYTSLALPYAGMAIFRSGWGTNDVTGFFDGGPFGAAHQHEDKLNFLIYANGKSLLGEGNKYAYDTSDIRSYVLSTRAHNTIRINGMDQNRRKNYKWQPEMLNRVSELKFSTNEDYDRASSVYDEGYGDEKKRIATHRRDIVFVKKPKCGQPFFIVTDTLSSASDNSYEAIWHFDVEDVTLTENGVKSSYITAFLCGDTGTKEIVKGIYGPEAQGWICRNQIQGSNEPVPTLLHKVWGRNIFTVTVFSVHDGGESPIFDAHTDGNTVTVLYRNGTSETVTL